MSHCSRLPSDSKTNAPLRVPTSTRTLLILAPSRFAGGHTVSTIEPAQHRHAGQKLFRRVPSLPCGGPTAQENTAVLGQRDHYRWARYPKLVPRGRASDRSREIASPPITGVWRRSGHWVGIATIETCCW